MGKKLLRFETAEEARAACDAMNAGRRTKHVTYRIDGDGFPTFFTVGRNSGEARANAATVLNITATVEETVGLLERIAELPEEELAELREILMRNNLGAFLRDGT